MAGKCIQKRRHLFQFELSQLVTSGNDYNEVVEGYNPPAQTLRRWGTYKTRIPTEYTQANVVHGALGYDLELPWDKALAAVTADWRVRILTEGGMILSLRGPAADPDGTRKKLTFVAVKQTD